jgi:hypothetical protein
MGKGEQGKSSCEVCGKNEECCFEVHLGGEIHVFDSFECAISGLMPRCSKCGSILLSPGIQFQGMLYCSYACVGVYNMQET